MEQALVAELEEVQDRLEEIKSERENLAASATSRHEELLDEEHELETRLEELRDHVAKKEAGTAEKKAAAQTDLTRSPKLPETPDE